LRDFQFPSKAKKSPNIPTKSCATATSTGFIQAMALTFPTPFLQEELHRAKHFLSDVHGMLAL
jgi:hypothetical protein